VIARRQHAAIIINLSLRASPQVGVASRSFAVTLPAWFIYTHPPPF